MLHKIKRIWIILLVLNKVFNMNLTMNHDYEDELIDPDVLADMSDSMPTKVPLRRYLTAMSNLRAKNYSYAEIAAWMSKQLKVDITRSQVAYALNIPASIQAEEDKLEALEDEAEEHS